MKKLAAASGLFLLFLLAGGTWVSLVQVLPDGLPRAVIVISLAVAYAGLFVSLLISRVRAILGGTAHLLRDAAVAAAELALLVVGFAAVYQRLGIVDDTGAGPRITHSFTDSLYYSVATFTTLGYGDFYPVGVGRAIAGLEALTGYVVLGLLASTAASAISPRTEAGWRKERDTQETRAPSPDAKP